MKRIFLEAMLAVFWNYNYYLSKRKFMEASIKHNKYYVTRYFRLTEPSK